MQAILAQIPDLLAAQRALLNTETAVKRAEVVEAVNDFITSLTDDTNTDIEIINDKIRFLNGDYVLFTVANAANIFDKLQGDLIPQLKSEIEALGIRIVNRANFDISSNAVTFFIALPLV